MHCASKNLAPTADHFTVCRSVQRALCALSTVTSSTSSPGSALERLAQGHTAVKRWSWRQHLSSLGFLPGWRSCLRGLPSAPPQVGAQVSSVGLSWTSGPSPWSREGRKDPDQGQLAGRKRGGWSPMLGPESTGGCGAAKRTTMFCAPAVCRVPRHLSLPPCAWYPATPNHVSATCRSCPCCPPLFSLCSRLSLFG